MCHNSELSDHILFILGLQHLSWRTTIWVQTACHVNAGCLETELKILGFMTSLTTYCSIANIWNWCACWPQGPVTWPILRYLIHPQGAMIVNSLTIFNDVIMRIVNVVILY